MSIGATVWMEQRKCTETTAEIAKLLWKDDRNTAKRADLWDYVGTTVKMAKSGHFLELQQKSTVKI